MILVVFYGKCNVVRLLATLHLRCQV
jgi:hypothetical protein